MLVYSRRIKLVLSKLQKAPGLAVFVVDLENLHKSPEKYGVYAAHYRNLCDTGILTNSYVIEWDPRGMDPIEMLHSCLWYEEKASHGDSRREASSLQALSLRF
mgnify:CR=1 FL=1|jgi:hypothetical protein